MTRPHQPTIEGPAPTGPIRKPARFPAVINAAIGRLFPDRPITLEMPGNFFHRLSLDDARRLRETLDQKIAASADRCPTTADGAPFEPGRRYWTHIGGGEIVLVRAPAAVAYIEDEGLSEEEAAVDIGDCYSTPEAAAASVHD